jgi:hypothetical protein
VISHLKTFDILPKFKSKISSAFLRKSSTKYCFFLAQFWKAVAKVKRANNKLLQQEEKRDD